MKEGRGKEGRKEIRKKGRKEGKKKKGKKKERRKEGRKGDINRRNSGQTSSRKRCLASFWILCQKRRGSSGRVRKKKRHRKRNICKNEKSIRVAKI